MGRYGPLQAPFALGLADAVRFRHNSAGSVNMASAKIIGESAQMQALREEVRKAAASEATVLITGETGTGKGVVAQAIHEASNRGARHMQRIEMGGLVATLVESDLFGHEKGAFTGAIGSRMGPFEKAAHSSVFLNEIGDMPLPLQARLLHVLEERYLVRVGGTTQIPMDARVIAATHRDLEAMVKAGDFRGDLYFRLNVFRIKLPPLREHPEDIGLLCDLFIGDGTRWSISPEALRRLESYGWPGNARELRNVIQGAIAKHPEEPRIEVWHFEERLQDPDFGPSAVPERPRLRTRRRQARAWSNAPWEEQICRLLGGLIVYGGTKGSRRERLNAAHDAAGFMSRATVQSSKGRAIIQGALDAWRREPHRTFAPRGAGRSGGDLYDYDRAVRELRPELNALRISVNAAPSPAFPSLPWIEWLVETVGQKRWVFAPLIAGDGAEEVVNILQPRLTDSAVRRFDVGAISGDLLSSLRVTFSIGDDHVGACQVAQAVAAGAHHLVLVISGCALFANENGPDALGQIAQTIKSFKNCSFAISVVVVSAVPLTHFAPVVRVGSFAGELNELLLAKRDETMLRAWGESQLAELSPEDRERVLTQTCGRWGAINAAVAAGARVDDIAAAVRAEHQRSALAVYSDLPQCCQKALCKVANGDDARKECVNMLTAARILVEDGGRLAPTVPDWTPVFLQARNGS